MPLKIDKTEVLKENGSLMKDESIAECSPWSILQYFWPALSDNPYWKPILVFCLSGRLRQVLLYVVVYSLFAVVPIVLGLWCVVVFWCRFWFSK